MEGLFSLLLFAGFFYLMMRFGCGAHHTHGYQSGHAHYGTPGDQRVNYIDPVCGMEVSANQGYSKTHEGALYRFCSRRCLDNFEAAPERYIKAAQDMSAGGET